MTRDERFRIIGSVGETKNEGNEHEDARAFQVDLGPRAGEGEQVKRLAAVAAVCALAGSSFACGDDEEELSADDRRYCELVAEIEAEGEQAFSSIGDDASEDEVAAAQKAFIEEVDDELDELVEVAPDEIAEDVEAFDAFTRAQMNGEETEEVSDAKIVEWEEENCPS